jgi:NAD(P)-dependent dehydrogenase (short-subunit alcohol dehydrogenase family)
MEDAMAGRFAGRVAVVTGGVSGIGFAICRRLAAEGAKLAVWDRDRAALDGVGARLGVAVHTECLDLVDAAAVMQAGVTTAQALGRIDMLVASAGIAGPNAPTWEYPIADWQRIIDVNVNGVFYCNRSVVPHMLAGGWGRIVNIASIAGKEGNPNAVAYSASKAAVIGMTKSLGKELAKTDIRVNCVTPAAVATPIFDQMAQSQIDFMLSKIPMGRFGTVDEVAAMVAWLCSEEASFSTGAVFDCSGGHATY